MAVESTDNRIPYIGNGVLTVYPYPFRIFTDTDLQVFVAGVLKTIDIDYSVDGVGVDEGGNVTFVVAPANLASIVIIRVLPLTQEAHYPSNDKFPATVHEAALDKLTMIIQQLDEVDHRSIKVAITSTFEDLLLPDPVTGKFLRWGSLAALENADITLVGSLGLPVSSANGGTGLAVVGAEGEKLTSVAGAIAYKPAGQIRLTNKSGAQQVAGTVVIPDTANDSAFNVTTTVGSPRPVAIVEETIADSAAGYLRQRGLITVNVQGNVTRYDFIRTSATSGRAESAGSSKVTGAFAMALTTYSGGAAGTVVAILFGDTYTAAALPAYVDAPPRDNLLIAYATASTLTITADGVKMLDAAGVGRVKRALSVTADITTTGLNGRDTAAAEAGTKWYWIWAVSNGATDGILLVPDAGAGSPTEPSASLYAWVYKLLIGVVFNNGSSDFTKFRQRGMRFDYTGDTTDGPPIVFTATTGVTSFTARDIAAFIPPSWVKVVRAQGGTSVAIDDFGFAISPNASGEYAVRVKTRGGAVTAMNGWFNAVELEVQWISGVNLYWRTTVATAATYRLGINGFDLIT